MTKESQPYWPNNNIYFLTGSTFLHHPYFKEDKQKQLLLSQIKKVKNDLNIPISAYSIAINHYHLKFYLKNGLDLARVKQLIHGGTFFLYKKEYNLKHNNLWQSSHILIVTSEEMDIKITAYIGGNLIKHKEVSTFQELGNNQFSSYKYFKEKRGDQFAQKLVQKYY